MKLMEVSPLMNGPIYFSGQEAPSPSYHYCRRFLLYTQIIAAQLTRNSLYWHSPKFVRQIFFGQGTVILICWVTSVSSRWPR